MSDDKAGEAEALYRLGLAKLADKQFADAAAALEQVTQRAPHVAPPYFHLGVALEQLGHAQRARVAYEAAIARDQSLAEAHANLGVLKRKQGDHAGAIAAYSRAIALRPDFVEALRNLGAVLSAEKRFDEALAAYDRALALAPNDAITYFNIGNLRRGQRDWDAAIVAYERALLRAPDFAQAWSNLGMCFAERGEPERALVAYDKAIALKPAWGEPRWNRALTHLALGEYESGWGAFEFRNQFGGPRSRPLGEGAVWRGESLADKTLLIHCEMGIGDVVQFVRFVPQIAREQKPARVILECHPTLHVLLQTSLTVDEIVTTEQPLPRYDVRASVMSLPHYCRTTLATIPAAPYIAPDRERLTHFAQVLGARTKPRIGLVWAGDPRHPNDRDRSVALAAFAPFAAARDHVEFVSLQKGAATSQLAQHDAFPILDLDHESHVMADTAAAIAHLDLVITVDTSVAHVAGAMGTPVWILLAFAPDWRWLIAREDSPWYPSARLFRQTAPRDWRAPIADVTARLVHSQLR